MTEMTDDTAIEAQTHLSHIQGAASKLVAQLCDRSAYASHDEYEEILSLVRALRQFCGLMPHAGAGR